MDKWEIARDRIVLKKSIGHGAFGVVWRARLSHPDGRLANQTVAAKCFTRETQLIFSALLLNRPILPWAIWVTFNVHAYLRILQPPLERMEEKL